MADPRLSTIDVIIIVTQFLAVFVFGLWSSFKSNRNTLSGYFLAGREMNWVWVGLSLFVSNLGTASYIGLGGAAAMRGYPVYTYELSALICLLFLAHIFMPVYLSSGCYTMPEFIKIRYGSEGLSILLAATLLFIGITTNLAGEMYAGIILIQESLGWPLYASLCAILVMTAVYTISGGLTAVVYTDALQSMLIIFGSMVLSIIALVHVGGFDGLYDMYMDAVPADASPWNNSCGVPQEADWHLFQPADDPTYPWPGVSIGIIILSSYYWCTNQIIVQRTLAAKNIYHAKAASILGGYLKLLPFFMTIIPGMVSRAIFPDVACQTPEGCMEACGNSNGCSDRAYPKLMLALLPTGLKGLMLATMLAALMTSLTSVFNSLSSIFTIDIWTKLRKTPSSLELLVVGRITTGVIAVIAALWIPIIQAYGAGELYTYIQSMSSYLFPPVLSIFTAGVAWGRTTAKGATAGFIAGIVMGVLRLCGDFLYATPGCGEVDTRPGIVRNLQFLHFAMLLFAVCFIVIIVVSLLTEPSPNERVTGLTFWTRNQTGTEIPGGPVESPKEDIGNNVPEPLTTVTAPETDDDVAPMTSFVLKYLCCYTGDNRLNDATVGNRAGVYTAKSRVKDLFVNINSGIALFVGLLIYIILR